MARKTCKKAAPAKSKTSSSSDKLDQILKLQRTILRRLDELSPRTEERTPPAADTAMSEPEKPGPISGR
jgi:hypothetical protein